MINKNINLFIVGAPKCGTTALHSYLSEHPDICMSDPKEPNYFSSLITPFSQTDEDYINYCFSHYINESVAGEASPLYLACPQAAQKIATFNPEAKIIIMLRHPVTMMHSLHSEFNFIGSEKEGSFEKALTYESQRLKDDSTLKLCYRFMTDYSEQIQRYLKHFDSDQVLILMQEDMNKNTPAIYKQVLDFLAVNNTFLPKFPQVNSNKKVRNETLRSFLTNPPGWMRALARGVLRNETLQHTIRKRMRRLNQKINAKNVKRESIPTSLYNQLVNEKETEIVKLSQLIDRDLSHWLIKK